MDELYDRIFQLHALIEEVDQLLLKTVDRNLKSRLKLRRKYYQQQLDDLTEFDEIDIPENSNIYF